MKPYDLAIPTLPSRSVSATVGFYKRFGFEGGVHEFNSEYAILTRGAIELHFFTHVELVPGESSAGCYIRVLNVDDIYRSFSSSKLPRTGIPRMDALEDKPWGLRELSRWKLAAHRTNHRKIIACPYDRQRRLITSQEWH